MTGSDETRSLAEVTHAPGGARRIFRGRNRSSRPHQGLTLFELLTLTPAFTETRHAALIQHKMSNGPARPRSINPAIPRDLETITARASALDPSHRYASAGDLADDLRRFLDDRPIRARRVTPIERLWRWARRNPAMATLSAATMLLLAARNVEGDNSSSHT